MLDETVKDYVAYMKLNVSSELKTVQDVIDNMLTRLEELSSVLQMIKSKNSECASSVSEDINKYRTEVITLSKKINTLNEVMVKVHNNVDTLEKHVEKAELDFGVNNDNRIKSFLKPFLKRSSTPTPDIAIVTPPISFQFQSVLDNFDECQ